MAAAEVFSSADCGPVRLSDHPNGAWFVLCGGEAQSLQGGPYATREFVHTSIPFVGEAYTALRSAGVPMERIITIAQLDDYLRYLRSGVAEAIPDQQIPGHYYQEQLDRTSASCARWLAESEGGRADYDHADVNPATFMNVLAGKRTGAESKVVPADSDAPVFFGLYSHGDSHAAKREGDGGAGEVVPHSYHSAEWFIHFPYPAPGAEEGQNNATDMYDFVATEGQSNHRNLLYATQIRLALHALAPPSSSPTSASRKKRPVISLLNCCRSGGLLEFMRRPSAIQPDLALFSMCSSQGHRDSLVSGFWSAFFSELRDTLRRGSGSDTDMMQLFSVAERRYHRENKYEALNHLKEAAFSYDIWQSEFHFSGARVGNVDPWHLDLTAALTTAWESEPASDNDNGPDWTALERLQQSYETGGAFRVTTKPSAQRPTHLVRGVTQPIEGVAQLQDGRWVIWTRSRQHLGERLSGTAGRSPLQPLESSNGRLVHENEKTQLLFEGDEVAPELATRPYRVRITAWKGSNAGRSVDLVETIKRIYADKIAIPGQVHNRHIEGRSVHELLRSHSRGT
mmetsp:Transcript_13058/g.27591  ORF Transcript_13058/g.27591 Transcript_13058/m.27591 type:complete len:569 (-) Transcript_13058:65-1771(-)